VPRLRLAIPWPAATEQEETVNAGLADVTNPCRHHAHIGGLARRALYPATTHRWLLYNLVYRSAECGGGPMVVADRITHISAGSGTRYALFLRGPQRSRPGVHCICSANGIHRLLTALILLTFARRRRADRPP